MKTKKVPKLRFPEFDGEWEEKRLGDIILEKKDNRGKTPPISSKGYPLLEVNSIGNKKIDYSKVTKYVSEETYLSWFRNYLKRGDVLFSTVGNTGLVSYFDGTINSVIAQNIVGFTFSQNGLFMHYLLNTTNNNKKVKSIEMNGVQPSIKVTQLIDLKFSIPTLHEQTRIASFLSIIDEKIENQEQIISKLETIKKGYLQKIFSQEIRFKDQDGNEFPEWREVQLSDIGYSFNGLSGKTKEDFGHGHSQYIAYMDVFKNAALYKTNGNHVDVKSNENQNVVKYGDILFTQSSETIKEVGMSSVWLNEEVEPYLNSFCFGFRISDKERISPLFMGYMLRSEEAREQIVKEGQGSTRFNISPSRLLSVKIAIPLETKEQQVIAEFLSTFDQKIDVEKQKLEKWKQIKKGLLQQMFV